MINGLSERLLVLHQRIGRFTKEDLCNDIQLVSVCDILNLNTRAIGRDLYQHSLHVLLDDLGVRWSDLGHMGSEGVFISKPQVSIG